MPSLEIGELCLPHTEGGVLEAPAGGRPSWAWGGSQGDAAHQAPSQALTSG